MAILRFPDSGALIESEPDIRSTLAGLGIDYERWSSRSRSAGLRPPMRSWPPMRMRSTR